LLDDHYATIVTAVEEGRRLDHVLRTFVRYLLATNLSEVLIVIVGAALALAGNLRDAAGDLLLPLTAAQILWINLVTDGLPALALALDPAPGVMRRPPHAPERPLLERREFVAVVLTGACTAAIGLAVLELSRRTLGSAEAARGALFASLTASQLLLAYVARGAGSAPGPNGWLALAVGAGLAAVAAVFAWPPLGAALGVVRGPLAAYAPAAAGVVATVLAGAAVQRLVLAPRGPLADPARP
jgi:Ca2+-transporting ATPase